MIGQNRTNPRMCLRRNTIKSSVRKTLERPELFDEEEVSIFLIF